MTTDEPNKDTPDLPRNDDGKEVSDDSASNNSSSSSEEEDDEETLERMRAFQRQTKQIHHLTSSSSAANKATGAAAPTFNSVRSLRRFDEYGDFLTRSERSHVLRKQEREEALKQQQQRSRHDSITTPGVTDEGGSGIFGAPRRKKRVDFLQPTPVASVLETPELTEDEKARCFMTDKSWSRIDMDIELTKKRWDNHVNGLVTFDAENNTLRGLEVLFDPKEADRDNKILRHQEGILKETIRQRMDNEYLNWNKLRSVSLKSSTKPCELARARGKQDERDRIDAWSPKKNVTSTSPKQRRLAAPKKKKWGFKGIFGSSKKG